MEAQTIINVGEKIKEFRSVKNMSLRSLSERSGISANALSLIERSKTSPTVTTLTAIARAFNVRMDEFFNDDGEGRTNFAVCRGIGTLPGKPMEALAPNLKQQNLNPLLVRLGPKQRFRRDLCFHPGDEFVYCLSGEIECEVGEEKILLMQGDAITYKAEMPHRLNNVAPAGSQALVIFEVGHLV